MTNIQDVNDMYDWERSDGTKLDYARKRKRGLKEDMDPNHYMR